MRADNHLVLMLLLVLGPLAHQAFGAEALRIGTTSPIALSTVFEQKPGEDGYLRNLIAPPVVALGKSWRWECIVCTKLPTLDDKTLAANTLPKRGMVAQFSIAPQWHWGDGKPVTGHDVAFTLRVLRARRTDPIYTAPQAIRIVVNAKDPRRFSLELSHIRSDFQTVLAISLLPAHLERQIFPSTNLDDASHGIIASNPTHRGLYYGPYFPTQVTEREVTLSSLDAPIRDISLRHFTSAAALNEAVDSHAVDMTREGDLSLTQIDAITRGSGPQANTKVRAVIAATHAVEHLVVNNRNPVLADLSVRQALLYGLDRDRIVSEVYRNYGLKADQLYHPKDPFASKSLKTYPLNPRIAEQLLDGAGWTRGVDGIRRKNDRRLEFVIDSNDSRERREIFEIIKASWHQIGVECTLATHHPSHFTGEVLARAKFRDMALVTLNHPPATGLLVALHSREIPSSDNGYSGQNVGAFRKKEVDTFLLQIMRSLDQTRGLEAARSLMLLYANELPTLPLAFKPKGALIPNWLDNFRIPGHVFASTLDAALWRRIDSKERLF